MPAAMSGTGFARLLKRHRIAAGLSQGTLAERAGVSVEAISALERGARHAPYKATLDRLTEALALDQPTRSEFEEAAKLARGRRPHARHRDSVGNLPPQLTSFVNREKAIAEIKGMLESNRTVALVGTGGAGKTRCAIKVGMAVLDAFDDGVWLAELAPISDPTLVAAAIARTLNVQESISQPILDTLLTHLKRKQLLLIADNCEHVIDEARRVIVAILRSCPNVRILATSRESLTIAGEQTFRMPSLPCPSPSETATAELMLQYAAVQLFNDRAVSADHAFALSVESAPDVAEICRRLDGIPLAIELAAARVKVLSPKQLAQKLDERFRVLTGGDRSALPRHRTIRAVIDWSHDLLTDEERRLFRRLSIFAGDFSIEMASAVCGDDMAEELAVPNLLFSLVDKSLVQAEQLGTSKHHRLLESTRDYAREKLVDFGEFDEMARRHARAFLELAEKIRDAWETTPDSAWLAQAEQELQNFDAALGWALNEQRDVLLGQQLAGALYPVWRYFPVEGRRWVETAQQVRAETPTSVLAALDLTESTLASMLGQHKASLPPAERALAHYRDLADPYGVAEAKRRIGHAKLFLGEIVEGEALLLQVLDEYRRLGARRSLILALQSLALARRFAGDLAGARQLFREALAVARAVGSERPAAIIALNLAETEFRGGDALSALRLAGESLTVLGAVDDARLVANARYNMAAYLVALTRYDEARTAAREALSAARDMDWSVGIAFTLQHLAAIAAMRPNAHATLIEDRRRAAQILAFVDARLSALEALREYTEQQEYDGLISALRDGLGEDELAELIAEGGTWSEDQAVAEAMLI